MTAEELREAVAASLYESLFTPQFQGTISTEGVTTGPTRCEFSDLWPMQKALMYKGAEAVIAVVLDAAEQVCRDESLIHLSNAGNCNGVGDTQIRITNFAMSGIASGCADAIRALRTEGKA